MRLERQVTYIIQSGSLRHEARQTPTLMASPQLNSALLVSFEMLFSERAHLHSICRDIRARLYNVFMCSFIQTTNLFSS